MSTQPVGKIPKVTLGWRLQMALGDMKSQEMADALGVSRSTCARWMHDRGATPKRAYILQWAMLTGTDARWLETGDVSSPSPGGGESSHTAGQVRDASEESLTIRYVPEPRSVTPIRPVAA